MLKTVRCRYAPSPTGLLHLGNARTALLAYAQARTQGGTFVMRVEDLDRQRSRAEYVAANLSELRWLGLSWDEGPDVGGAYGPYIQSERFGRYEEALELLERSGNTFPCYLSRKDVQELASAPHGSGSAYGRVQRQQNDALKAQREAEGKTPSLRFRVEKGVLELHDDVLGNVTLNPAEDTGDFVVRRADGEWAYQLAVVVDDSAMHISHILRGDDLLPSTGAQLLLYEALGQTPPRFAHVPLLLDTDGKRMAKRQGSLTLSALREAGVRPERVVRLLGYSLDFQNELREMTLDEFVLHFDLETLPTTAFRLKPHHLEFLYG